MSEPKRGIGRLTEPQIFLALTVVIGILAGLSAVLFSLTIHQLQTALFGLTPSATRLVLVPTLVSIVTGMLLAYVFKDVRGSGVPQTEVAFHLKRGIIPLRVPIGKFITGVLCIGSGHSMGREGPSVQIGAGIASWVGQWLHLSPERVKNLVPVGATAALSAAFNTPVAAVLFALEEIIADMNAPLLGSTVVASVAAVIVERSILGNDPLFRVPSYHLVHPGELIAYAVLGIVGGAASVAFCKGLLALRAAFARLPEWTKPWQPAMGGLMIGITLLFVPQVAGVGYQYVDQALNGGLLMKTMVLLCVMKMGATIVSYASGNAGGIFAPSLYLGAMLGGAVGILAQRVAPFPVGEPGAYALVGMGALFAGIIRAPMTSVFMIFEITQDYQILVPLMVANMLSLMISRRYQREPVYHALLKQDGIHLASPAARGEETTWRARDVMTGAASWVNPATTAADAFMAVPHSTSAVLVGAPPELEGIVTRDAIAAAVSEGRGATPVAELVDLDAVHAHPDHGMDVVLSRLRRAPGMLPIVSREDAHRLEGVVTRESIFERARDVDAD